MDTTAVESTSITEPVVAPPVFKRPTGRPRGRPRGRGRGRGRPGQLRIDAAAANARQNSTPVEEKLHTDLIPDLDVDVQFQLLRWPRTSQPTTPLSPDFENNTNRGVSSLKELPKIEFVPNKPIPLPKYSLIQQEPIDENLASVTLLASSSTSSSSSSAVSSPSSTTKRGKIEISTLLPPPHQVVLSESRPYIVHEVLLEDELAERIEYDMDEHDKHWLHDYNELRVQQSESQVPYLFFELVIDRIEKEWFNLKMEVAKHEKEEEMSPEEGTCAICDDGECENSNAIVFCDGCNLAVHQECYGIPLVPEGQWLCRRCMLSPGIPLNCIFCPSQQGAFKQTSTNRWAHSLCALWIPEVGVANPTYMEPIDQIENIPKSRWKLTCYICKNRMGCCIQCANKFCFASMHVTCARRAKLCMKITPSGDGEMVDMAAYCDKHTPLEYLEQHKDMDIEANVRKLQKEFSRSRRVSTSSSTFMGEYYEVVPADETEEEEDDDRRSKRTSSNSKGKSTENKPTPVNGDVGGINGLAAAINGSGDKKDLLQNLKQIIPHKIYTSVINKVQQASQFQISKRSSVVTQICKYWALKREAGRGAPLLKRLHLEPWRPPLQIAQEDLETTRKRLEALMVLRNDLERVRMLCDMIVKREKRKFHIMNTRKSYFELLLTPLYRIFREIVKKLKSLDKDAFFHNPVPLEIAPDYLAVIKQPMDLTTLLDRVDGHQYRTFDEFQTDLSLIPANCMTYNPPESIYYKSATRFKKHCDDILVKAKNGYIGSIVDNETGFLPFDCDEMIFSSKIDDDYEPVLKYDKLDGSGDGTSGLVKGVAGGASNEVPAVVPRKRKGDVPVSSSALTTNKRGRTSSALPTMTGSKEDGGRVTRSRQVTIEELKNPIAIRLKAGTARSSRLRTRSANDNMEEETVKRLAAQTPDGRATTRSRRSSSAAISGTSRHQNEKETPTTLHTSSNTTRQQARKRFATEGIKDRRLVLVATPASSSSTSNSSSATRRRTRFSASDTALVDEEATPVKNISLAVGTREKSSRIQQQKASSSSSLIPQSKNNIGDDEKKAASLPPPDGVERRVTRASQGNSNSSGRDHVKSPPAAKGEDKQGSPPNKRSLRSSFANNNDTATTSGNTGKRQAPSKTPAGSTSTSSVTNKKKSTPSIKDAFESKGLVQKGKQDFDDNKGLNSIIDEYKTKKRRSSRR